MPDDPAALSHVRIVRPAAADWRQAMADSLDAHVAAIDGWLDATDDLEAMFAADPTVAHELRTVAAIVRGRRNDFAQTSVQLRAAIQEAEAEAAARG